MIRRCHVAVVCAVLTAACTGNNPVAPSDPGAASWDAPYPFTADDGVGFCHTTRTGVSCVVQSYDSEGASILVRNSGSAPVAVNFSVYQRFAPDTLESQVYYADGSTRISSLAPGASTVLSVTFPECAWQADVYVGPEDFNPPHTSGTLLGYEFGGGDLCVVPPDTPGVEGCTPGYWKNHDDSWVATGYSPLQNLNTVFTIPASLGAELANTSLIDALAFGGGSGVSGAARILARAAVAALLNASHPDVDYPRTLAEVIAASNTAFGSGNRGTMLTLAEQLDRDNNLGCSLSK